VFELNGKISRTASEIVGAPLSGIKSPELNVADTIQKNLGRAFLFLFKSDVSPAMEDRQLVQAVLQIFLARSCAELIDCWSLERYHINRGMKKLYERILKTGVHPRGIPYLKAHDLQKPKWWQGNGGNWPLGKCRRGGV
jgi:hypothetical protein